MLNLFRKKIIEEPVHKQPAAVAPGVILDMTQKAVDLFTEYTSNNGRVVSEWELGTFFTFVDKLSKIFEGGE